VEFAIDTHLKIKQNTKTWSSGWATRFSGYGRSNNIKLQLLYMPIC